MASNIIHETIDGEYPVAGIDNDSQGFRDNFTVIKSSLAAAKTETEDLQTNVSRKDTDNNHAGNKIIDAELDHITLAFIPIGTVNGAQNISFLNGHYQQFEATQDFTLTLADWPAAGRLAKMTVEFTSDDGSTRNVTFQGEGNAVFRSNVDTWAAGSSQTQVIATSASDDYPTILEFWTHDGGDTIFADYKGVYDVPA
jgi:hypothetical protein